MNEEETDSYGLIVSFEDQSASYVNGYEAGQLAMRMRGDAPTDAIDGVEITVHADNRVTIERMCTAWGWAASWRTDGEFPEWAFLTLTRSAKPTDKPNPHGLKVVK